MIQAKLGTDETVISSGSPRIFTFLSRANSAIYIQVTSIALIGLLSYLLTPILMGKGFSPNIGIVIAGTTSEVLLMKCLYDLSSNTSEFSQNLLIYLMTLQVVFLIFIGFAGIKLTIDLIWISSCMAYLVWQVINLARSRK